MECGKTVDAEKNEGISVHSYRINDKGKQESDFIHICDLDEGHDGDCHCSCGVVFPDEEVLKEIKLANLQEKHTTLMRQYRQIEDRKIEIEDKMNDKRKEIGTVRDRIYDLTQGTDGVD